MELSVIIPTRNEERHIENTIEKVDSYLSKIDFLSKYEIVISDYSTDSTPDIVKRVIKNNNRIKYTTVIKKGIGSGLRKGIDKAIYETVLFYCADLTYSLDTINVMLTDLLNNKVELALGSRRVKGGSEIKSNNRLALSKIYSLLVRLAFNLNIKDTQGLFSFKKTNVSFLDKIFSDDGFYQTELVLLFKKHKLKIKEYPVIQIDRPNEESNINPIKDSYTMFLNLIKFFIKYNKNKLSDYKNNS